MKNGLFYTTCLLLLALLSSCSTGRELAYIADAQRDTAQAILTTYSTTIHPGDRLYIYVSSQVPESVVPFNEETNRAVSIASTLRTQEQAGGAINGYLVDDKGRIVFPVLGEMMVAGMTRDSLSFEISSRLREEGYVSDAIVSVDLMNFRVTVVGEVHRPQELHVVGNRLTLFEALALCGDITLYGRRDNIVIVRQCPTPLATPEGEAPMPNRSATCIVGEVDLTSKAFLDSPYYYLHPGDIVYVEPDDLRERMARRDPNIPQYTRIGVQIAAEIMKLVRTNYLIQRTRR